MKIVVVDDHGIVCYGYSQLIATVADLQLVGIAQTQSDAVALIGQTGPDVAIVDLTLRDGDGLDLLRVIRQQYPRTRTLVVSAHDDRLYAHRVVAAGALGYLNKHEAPQRLIDGVRAVSRGEWFFDPEIFDQVVQQRSGQAVAVKAHGIDRLTNRELQVFQHIGSGRSTRQIADLMALSTKTIERHKENIKLKLNLEHATALAQHATQWVIRRDG